MKQKLKKHLDIEYENAQSSDHINETALSIFADLNGILESSEKQDFQFLSYLLRMARLEAQSLVCESRDEVSLHPANYESRH